MMSGRSRAKPAMKVVLRRATLADLPILRAWDVDAEVIASGAGRSAEVWAAELPREVDWYEPLIAERLLSAPRAMLLPHLGSASIATRTRMAHLACDGVIAVLAGTIPPNLVHP